MVNQICRMEPAPLISASVAVDPAFTSTQSALPPERSALEARRETGVAQIGESIQRTVLLSQSQRRKAHKKADDPDHGNPPAELR